jgi:hypothetical protein
MSSIMKVLCLTAALALAGCGGAEGSAPSSRASNAARIAAGPITYASPADACGPGNCTGCCDENGICRPGTGNLFCGNGGASCDYCSPRIDGDACGSCNGVITCYFPNDPCLPTIPPPPPPPPPACGPGNCAGCCDASGVCRAGTGNALCGMGGGACDTCSPRIDGTQCETCGGVTACYFLSQPCN